MGYRLKKAYGYILQFIQLVAGIDAAKKIDTRLRFGRSLNLANPTTLADKVSYIELHTDPDLRAQCSDKYEVRKFITRRGLEDILIPIVLDPVSDPKDIKFEELPNEYVLKATHGCGMNIIHTTSKNISSEETLSMVKQWLSTPYGMYSLEPHYLLIRPRIYAEKYLGELDQLVDYKFHCYNGEPSFVLTVSERSRGPYKLNAYTCNWQPIDCIVGKHVSKKEIPKPTKLNEMVKISKILAEGFDFVRVDLYEVKGKIWFGELTFTPAACVFSYFSEEFLEVEGRKLAITS